MIIVYGIVQVSETAEIAEKNHLSHPHERLTFDKPIEIKEEGSIYIFVSNDDGQNMDVYFDYFRVTHEYGDIVAGSDYYPFGLAMGARQVTRDPYRYGYQGQFSEMDEETGWNSFQLRQYDARIGRWTTLDPVMHFGESPYVGMHNNPTFYTDPDGACPTCPQGAEADEVYALGAIVDQGLYGSWEYLGGGEWKDLGVGDLSGANANNPWSISAYNPNFFGSLRNNINDLPYGLDFAGNSFYNTADDFYISFLQFGNDRRNLEGFGVYSNEITDAGVNTLGTAIPFGKLSNPLIKGINAAQFSKLFKGTLLTRLPPKVRGFLNRYINSQVVKQQVELVHMGAAGGAEFINSTNHSKE